MTRQGITSDTISLHSGSYGASQGRASALDWTRDERSRLTRGGGRGEKRCKWLVALFYIFFLSGFHFFVFRQLPEATAQGPPCVWPCSGPGSVLCRVEGHGAGPGASDQVR